MKLLIKFIFLTIITNSFLFPSVSLSLDCQGNLNYSSTVEIHGFQFSHNSCVDPDFTFSGAAIDNGFTVSASGSVVIAFSLTGSTIPAGEGVLIDGIECDDIDNISDLVFSGPVGGDSGGASLDVIYDEFTDNCYLDIQEHTLPFELEVNDIYPNPFNPTCNINYSIPSYGMVKVALIDINGREVQSLTNGMLSKGNYDIKIDGNNLSSGIYFLSILHDNNQLVRKLSLVK
tara:strand:+ start:3842 stop:4534 length:693 start_codon:yes stop_codon:yes gene_type:complete